MRAIFSILLVLLAFASGCAGKSPFPPPLLLRIQAAADANPDASGRASPIVVRVYQLKEAGKLESADFFQVYDDEAALLGDDQLWRQELTVVPGATEEITVQLAPGAGTIAVVAAFRDVRNSQWKSSAPIAVDQEDPPREIAYVVTVASDSISIERSR